MKYDLQSGDAAISTQLYQFPLKLADEVICIPNEAKKAATTKHKNKVSEDYKDRIVSNGKVSFFRTKNLIFLTASDKVRLIDNLEHPRRTTFFPLEKIDQSGYSHGVNGNPNDLKVQ